jgi:hypothetical protein
VTAGPFQAGALSIDGSMFAALSTDEKLALHRVLSSAGVSTLRCTRAPAFAGLHGELQAVRWPLRHDLITELPHPKYAEGGAVDMYAAHGISELTRPAPDSADWKCPDHGHEFVYFDSDDGQDYDQCPEPGCVNGKWYG